MRERRVPGSNEIGYEKRARADYWVARDRCAWMWPVCNGTGLSVFADCMTFITTSVWANRGTVLLSRSKPVFSAYLKPVFSAYLKAVGASGCQM